VASVVKSHTGFGLVEVELVSYESQLAPGAIHNGVASVAVYRVTQHPSLHRLPAQQGEAVEVEVPGVPQTTHRFELLQTVPASVHVLLAQQG
jgi:hypothetical protein